MNILNFRLVVQINEIIKKQSNIQKNPRYFISEKEKFNVFRNAMVGYLHFIYRE